MGRANRSLGYEMKSWDDPGIMREKFPAVAALPISRIEDRLEGGLGFPSIVLII